MKKLAAILFSSLIIGSAATVRAEGDYVVVLKEPDFITNDSVVRISDTIYLVPSYMDALALCDTENIKSIFADEPLDIPEVQLDEINAEYAYLNETAQYPDGANDNRYSEQWYLPVIKAQSVWKHGFTGEGVLVGIIDSGINTTHVDLIGKTKHAFNVPSANENVDDSYGHGTMVTGILAATANNSYCVSGITGGVDLAVIKVIEDSTDTPKISTLLSAVSKAIEMECDVVNMSLGWRTTNTESTGFIAIKDEIKRGVDKGIIFVASSGNYQSGSTTVPIYYPAAFDNVISVAATGRAKTDSDPDTLPAVDFLESSGSVTTILTEEPALFSVYNDKVTCAAPGYRIVSTFINSDSRTAASDGSSFAAPMVASAAVIAKQLDKTVNFARFEEYLKKSVRDIYTEGYDEHTGYGLLDLEAFINVVGEELFTPEPTATPEPEDVTGFEMSVTKKDNIFTVMSMFDEAQSDFKIIAAAYCGGRLVLTKAQTVSKGTTGINFRFTSDEEIDSVSLLIWDGMYPLSNAGRAVFVNKETPSPTAEVTQ